MRLALVLILAAALAIAAGIAIAVVMHSEPGLVDVCNDGAAVVRYAPPAVCAAVTLTWPRWQLPLDVYPVPSESRDTEPPVRRAIGDVNLQLGFEALRLSRVEAEADVTVTLDVPHEPGWMDAAGAVSHRREGARLSAQVLVSNVPDVTTLHTVLVHELGHVLGLDHDDFEDSAMYPYPTGVRPLRITDADRALLRRLYGRRP